MTHIIATVLFGIGVLGLTLIVASIIANIFKPDEELLKRLERENKEQQTILDEQHKRAGDSGERRRSSDE